MEMSLLRVLMPIKLLNILPLELLFERLWLIESIEISSVYAIPMEGNKFLVCYTKDKLHRVCMIDNTGRVIKCYGGRKGSGLVWESWICQAIWRLAGMVPFLLLIWITTELYNSTRRWNIWMSSTSSTDQSDCLSTKISGNSMQLKKVAKVSRFLICDISEWLWNRILFHTSIYTSDKFKQDIRKTLNSVELCI